jgi:hypothetical protein
LSSPSREALNQRKRKKATKSTPKKYLQLKVLPRKTRLVVRQKKKGKKVKRKKETKSTRNKILPRKDIYPVIVFLETNSIFFPVF